MDLKGNAAYKAAFQEVHEFYLKKWQDTALSQVDEREKIYMLMKLLKLVDEHILGRVSQGEAYFSEKNQKLLKKQIKKL